MEISVDMAAQILSYLPYTEIAAFKRVNGTFGCAVERYRKFLPKTTIHLAITSRGGETEKHARIIIFHKRKTFAFGMDPCCTNFETAFPLDGFVYSAKYTPKLLKLSTEEHKELFEIEQLVNILNSLGDHYPEVQFVLNREWIYAMFFRTLLLWLTTDSIDTFKFTWCFEKSYDDATSEEARHDASVGHMAGNFGRRRQRNPALEWKY